MPLSVMFLSALAFPMDGTGAHTASVPSGSWSATRGAVS